MTQSTTFCSCGRSSVASAAASLSCSTRYGASSFRSPWSPATPDAASAHRSRPTRGLGVARGSVRLQEFLPLLPVLLDNLNRLLAVSHKTTMRELFVELCLTVPVRLSALLPHLHFLMRPLVLALQVCAQTGFRSGPRGPKPNDRGGRKQRGRGGSRAPGAVSRRARTWSARGFAPSSSASTTSRPCFWIPSWRL